MKFLLAAVLTVFTATSSFAGITCKVIQPGNALDGLESFSINVDGSGNYLSQFWMYGGYTDINERPSMKVVSNSAQFFVLENKSKERLTVSMEETKCETELKEKYSVCYQGLAEGIKSYAGTLPKSMAVECAAEDGLNFNY